MRPRLTYANVISSIALLLVITGGTALATHPGGQNTISTADIINGEVKVADIGQGAVATDEIVNNQVKVADIGDGEVKTAEIANGQVRTVDIGADQVRTSQVLNGNLTGGDIAGDSLTGADIDEDSLAGALIPGIATSGLVKSSGVVRADVPGDGQVVVKPLLSSGPFDIDGFCGQFGGNVSSQVILQTNAAGFSLDSDADLGNNVADSEFGGAPALAQQLDAQPGDKRFDAGDYVAVVPGKLLTGEAATGVNLMGSDCVFAVTGIG